jgi:hypothetical protein
MKEVQTYKIAQAALLSYSKAFEHRYGMRPKDPNGRVSEDFRECLGRMKGHHDAVLEHYVEMSGPNEWFIKRAHSLECFIKDAAMVYADYCAKAFGPSSKTMFGVNPRAIKVRTNLYCGNSACVSGMPRGVFKHVSVLSTAIPEWICEDCVKSGYIVSHDTVKGPKMSLEELAKAACHTV